MSGHLEVKGLDFYYGPKQSLFGVDFDAQPNQVTALIGPSGCGKSTLLRIFNGIYRLYRGQRATGSCVLDGEDLIGERIDAIALRTRIGMVFQKPTAFAMSIFDNVAFGIRLAERLPHRQLADRVEEALRGAALWDEVKDELGKPGSSLSGGQQQRLCIARALGPKPAVLLMDEPTSALDPIATAHVEDLMEGLKQRTTVIIVTHNMQQAGRIADKTAFMYLGKLIEQTDTNQLFTMPGNDLTRQYITGRFG